MGLCDLHKEYFENTVNIIQLKKGKIFEFNLCRDCFDKYLDLGNLETTQDLGSLMHKNICPKCGISREELNSKKILCNNCCAHFEIIKKEDKINLFENKMTAAVEMEDYESAAIFKKEIDQLKNS